MAKSHQTSGKKEKEQKRLQKRKEKEERKEERKLQGKRSFEDMIAYVDEYGQITSTPPDPSKKLVVKSEDIQLGVPKHQPEDPLDALRIGTVTYFNESKGYGFIKELKNGESVFFHINGLVDQIQEGNKVNFEVERGKKGWNAINVTLHK